ncbi:hypothetical protein MRB53_037750 [Persea americana]|nr:hypothetical protein MRB53_037750 [Persea americana]
MTIRASHPPHSLRASSPYNPLRKCLEHLCHLLEEDMMRLKSSNLCRRSTASSCDKVISKKATSFGRRPTVTTLIYPSSLNLSIHVLSPLMRKLPLMPVGTMKEMDHAMYPIDYRNSRFLRISRNIDREALAPHEVSKTHATDFLLLEGSDPKDPRIAFDVSESEYLEDDISWTLDREAAWERSCHYRNWPTEHGPTYLRRVIQKVVDAELITTFDDALLPVGDAFHPLVTLHSTPCWQEHN